MLWPVTHNQAGSFQAWRPRNCRRINESTSRLMGREAGELNASRFLGMCVDGSHADIGYRCYALGNQDLLRHVNRQDADVEQETSSQEEVRDQGIPSAAAEACCSNCAGGATRIQYSIRQGHCSRSIRAIAITFPNIASNNWPAMNRYRPCGSVEAAGGKLLADASSVIFGRAVKTAT